MVRITYEPIDPRGSYDLIAGKTAGSVLFHYAVVKTRKGLGGVTRHIEYTPAGDAEEELAAIAAEICGSCAIEDIVLIRRVGRVGIGEIISLVAVSSPSSEDAFTACKFGISRLKKMRCISKNEVCG
ncbi:MAG TPA: molybdenum cofactor biosynthesis protein MoaE [Geobacteraceae bacterium]